MLNYSRIPVPPNLLNAIRLICFACLIYTALDVNVYSAAFFLLTIASLYGLRKKKKSVDATFREVDLNKAANNPFRRARRKKRDGNNSDEEPLQVTEKLMKKAKNDLFHYFYTDFSLADSLILFADVKNNSDCLFARKSKLWGAQKWNKDISVEDNVKTNVIPSFLIFSNFHEHLNLDGYLIHMSGSVYGSDVETFARGFCHLLESLAAQNPDGRNCMTDADEIIDSSKWVFEFNRATYFITTFAPFYSSNHSRYSHGVNECFVLFQPEISFARHNLPPDTPATEWTEPKTIRDRIRIQFKQSGREYLIRDTVNYPMSHDMIKPVEFDGPLVSWWKHRSNVS